MYRNPTKAFRVVLLEWYRGPLRGYGSSMERQRVSPWLATATAYAWRFLALAAAIGVALWVLGRLRVVVVPIAFALFFASLLSPIVSWFAARKVPSGVVAAAAVLLTVSLMGGVLVLAGFGVAAQADELGRSLQEGWNQLTRWADRSLPFSLEEVRSSVSGAFSGSSGLGSRVLGGAVTIAEIAIGTVLAFIVLFFLLKDGRSMFEWTLEHLPRDRRDPVGDLGTVMWRQLSRFARGQLAIAAIDAIATGIALIVIGVPLVVPLTLLTFIGGWVPLVGPVVAGAVAGLVALSDGGLSAALWIVLAEIAIQQVEGNLLQPVLQGRYLRLHPLVVLLGVVIGGVVGGIAGAFVATPLIAAGVAAASYLRAGEREREAKIAA